ncbi:hypothetical protein J7K27_01730 [Candidatus Bathyarchaeota archaeon]|nr:hypothetical protein [Candidatus Bathyarchaeota archaeon]
MSTWETISIQKRLLEEVEPLVRKGYYLCVSEFVTEAVQNLLEKIWRERKRLLYTRKHAWIENALGKTRVGLSEYAAKRLKTIIDVRTSDAGQIIKRGEPLALLETTSNRLFVLFSPVSGKINRVNERILEEPYLINEDAYGVGWIVEISPLNFEIEKEQLLSFEDYENWVSSLQGRLLQR